MSHADYQDEDFEVIVSDFRSDPYRWIDSLERLQRATLKGEVHAEL